MIVNIMKCPTSTEPTIQEAHGLCKVTWPPFYFLAALCSITKKLYNLKYFSYIMASSSNQKQIILFDFTNENVTKDVSDWYEVSDTVRTVGMSKGKN